MSSVQTDLGEVVPVAQAALQLFISGPWTVVAPNPGLQPDFSVETAMDGAAVTAIRARGNGSPRCFGYACCPVRFEAGKSYRLTVRFTAHGLERPEHQLVHGVYAPGFTAGVQHIRSDAGLYTGEEIFESPAESLDGELRLYFRYSSHGEVNWHEVRLEECPPPQPRLVTIVCRQGGMPPGATLDFWSDWLDRAGALHPDVVLLPELFDGSTPATPSAPDGATATLLSAKAAQWGMYTCGAFYQEREGLVHNSAPLYDRTGNLVGAYDKMMPYDPELDAGIVPGGPPQAWTTDFGRVGILTCNDAWFPETARWLAAQQAELVLLPNYGYWLEMIPARAADNGFCIAASSVLFPAGIWDSSGSAAGEAVVDLSRHSPSAILHSSIDAESGLLLAQVDLARKYSPHWKGGPMHSAPAARIHRQSSIHPVFPGTITPDGEV